MKSKTMLSGRSMRSLDAKFREEEDNSLLDVLADDKQDSPDNEVMRGCLRGQINTAFESLVNARLKLCFPYFGLDGEEPLTLDQIGARFSLTRERVRQIKEKALLDFDTPVVAIPLRTYSNA